MPTKPPAKKAAAKKTAAPGGAPAQDTLDRKQLALEYGFALSVLRSSPDLWKLFRQAVKQNWTQPKFTAELRNTDWFKTTSEAQRNALVLRKTDPATWKARVNQTRALIRDAAVQMGAQVTDEQVDRISRNVLRFGWNDAQIRDTLAGSIKTGAEGTYGGDAAANVEQLRQLARRNGVKLGDQQLQKWAVRLGAGESIEGFEQYVRQTASTAFPQYAEQLAAGMDVADIAEPYRQQMAQTLELNPEDIDLFDPMIRKTLQGVDQDGKTSTVPLWKFEQQLKRDERWQYTDNARETIDAKARRVLADFGFGY